MSARGPAHKKENEILPAEWREIQSLAVLKTPNIKRQSEISTKTRRRSQFLSKEFS